MPSAWSTCCGASTLTRPTASCSWRTTTPTRCGAPRAPTCTAASDAARPRAPQQRAGALQTTPVPAHGSQRAANTCPPPAPHPAPPHPPPRAGIAWLMSDLRPGDSLVFHFSGHGSQQRDTSGEEADGLNETICPADFRAAGEIVDDELNRLLVNPLPQVGSGRVVVSGVAGWVGGGGWGCGQGRAEGAPWLEQGPQPGRPSQQGPQPSRARCPSPLPAGCKAARDHRRLPQRHGARPALQLQRRLHRSHGLAG